MDPPSSLIDAPSSTIAIIHPAHSPQSPCFTTAFPQCCQASTRLRASALQSPTLSNYCASLPSHSGLQPAFACSISGSRPRRGARSPDCNASSQSQVTEDRSVRSKIIKEVRRSRSHFRCGNLISQFNLLFPAGVAYRQIIPSTRVHQPVTVVASRSPTA